MDTLDLCEKCLPKLRAHVESLPRYYFFDDGSEELLWISEKDKRGFKTYQAVIWDIQPIENQVKCEHRIKIIPDETKHLDMAWCRDCGKKLRATWQVSDE